MLSCTHESLQCFYLFNLPPSRLIALISSTRHSSVFRLMLRYGLFLVWFVRLSSSASWMLDDRKIEDDSMRALHFILISFLHREQAHDGGGNDYDVDDWKVFPLILMHFALLCESRELNFWRGRNELTIEVDFHHPRRLWVWEKSGNLTHFIGMGLWDLVICFWCCFCDGFPTQN